MTPDCKFALELRGQSVRERWLAALYEAAGSLRVRMPMYDFEILSCDVESQQVTMRGWHADICYKKPFVIDLGSPQATSSRPFSSKNLVVPGDHVLGGCELELDKLS